MLVEVLDLVTRLAVAGLFLRTGVVKFLDPGLSTKALQGLGVPTRHLTRAARMLAAFELGLVPIALFAPGGIAAALLGATFVAFGLVALFLFKRNVDCGCGIRMFRATATSTGVLVPRLAAAAAVQALWFGNGSLGLPAAAILLGLVGLTMPSRIGVARHAESATKRQFVNASSRLRGQVAWASKAMTLFGLAWLGSRGLAPVAMAVAIPSQVPLAGGELGEPCRIFNISIPLTVCKHECDIAVCPFGTCISGLVCCLFA